MTSYSDIIKNKVKMPSFAKICRHMPLYAGRVTKFIPLL